MLGIALTLIITGCSNIDLHNKDEYSRYSLYSLADFENNERDFYIAPNDSLYTSDPYLSSWFKIFNDTSALTAYIEKQEVEIRAWRKKAAELSLNKTNIEYLRTEIDTSYNSGNKKTNLTIYFLGNKKEYFFKMNEVYCLENKWAAYSIAPPTNDAEIIELERIKNEKIASEPYTPNNLYFNECSWYYQYATPKTFSNFYLTLWNRTENEFNRIKYKLTIYSIEGEYEPLQFSKTIMYREPIYPGDYVTIEVLELRNFYVGVNIVEKGNFRWEAEIIDAKPRPGYEEYY